MKTRHATLPWNEAASQNINNWYIVTQTKQLIGVHRKSNMRTCCHIRQLIYQKITSKDPRLKIGHFAVRLSSLSEGHQPRSSVLKIGHMHLPDHHLQDGTAPPSIMYPAILPKALTRSSPAICHRLCLDAAATGTLISDLGRLIITLKTFSGVFDPVRSRESKLHQISCIIFKFR